MSFTPSENPITNPTRESYTELRPFRFWCQKVLPLVYDDTLSYYELLCKVVDYLNKTMEDVDHMNTDMDTLYSNFQEFQEGTFRIYNELVTYVNTYFENLDVQDEINTKLDELVSDGTLLALITPSIVSEVTDWLNEHITETTPAIDNTLSVSGAGADSKTTGEAIAAQYSTSKTYNVGDYVLYNGTVYRCITDITQAETWTSAHWLATNIGNETGTLYKAETSNYNGLNIIDSSVIAGRTITLANNNDGTYTINNSTGRALFGKNYHKVLLNKGETYLLFGVPKGYSFVATEHEASGMVFKNETPVPALFTVNETNEYYVGYRLNTASQDAITIAPFLISSKAVYNEININELSNFINEKEHEVIINWFQNGRIAKSTGEIVTGLANNWLYSDYIDVSLVNSIRITGTTTGGSNTVCAIYDQNKNYIRGFDTNPNIVLIPDNGYYIRVSWNTYTEQTKVWLRFEDNTFNKEKFNNITFDTINVKAQLNWEAGGINNDTGKNYDPQQNRIRTRSLCYTDKTLIICAGELLESYNFDYKVHFWSDGNYENDKTSDSGWIRLPNKYVIPEKSYFRIVVYSAQYTDTITDITSCPLFKAIYVTDNFGDTLNELTFNHYLSNIFSLNIDEQTFVQSLKKTVPDLAKSSLNVTHDPLAFIHFSDIHARQELWKRIGEYANINKDFLSFGLHTGDYVDDNQTLYNDLYEYFTPDIPFLNCVGNHDTYGDTEHTPATKQSVYEKLFNHLTNWGVVFMPGDYSMTYYKDFPNSNIRLIVYDDYYDINEQKTWLSNTMNAAKALGYHVITASHQLTGVPVTKINCTFQTLVPYYETVHTISNTEFDAVIGEFITNGGSHIVHLCGHQHQDFLYITANNVLNCAVECATDWRGWTEGNRVKNTKSWDCFNCVGIDTDLGILKLVRIGSNVDCYNRAKNILSFNYVNKTVICNE